MKNFSKIALAATLVGTLAVSAIAPAAYAQEANNDGPKAENKQERKGKGEFRPVRGGHGFLNFICATEGADRLDKALEIMAIRLDVTDEQRPAFDDLKTAALTAQSDFAESCAPLKEAKPEGAADKMAHRVAMMELHLESMNSVLPAFEAFYDGLSDDQKAQINKFGEKMGKKGDKRHGARGHDGKGPRGQQNNAAPNNG